MSDTSQAVPDSVQEIEHEMEETRSELANKLETLGRKISGTVEDVEETVETVVETTHDTVEAIKNALNIPKQVEEHPWLAMGCSVLIGFVGGKLIGRAVSSSHRDQPQHGRSENGHAGPYANGRSASAPQTMTASSANMQGDRQTTSEGTDDQSADGWFEGLKSQFGSEISKAKGLAIGTLFGIIRDMARDTLPEAVKSEVADLFDDFTKKAGGEPIRQGGFVSDSEEESDSQERSSRESSSNKEKSMQSSTSQKWEGRWDQLKGRARQAWGDLTDDDFQRAQGDYEQLVGIIKERTGKTREEIEARLDS